MYIWNSFTFNGMSVLLFKTICPRKFNGGNQNLHMILNSGKKNNNHSNKDDQETWELTLLVYVAFLLSVSIYSWCFFMKQV